MPLPDALKAQATEVDEALEALSAAILENDDTAATIDPATVDQFEETVVTGEAPRAAAEGANATGIDTQGAEAPATAPHADDGYEQRYKTLEGKYRAEVPRLMRELDFLRGQIAVLKDGRPVEHQSPAAPEPPAVPPHRKYLTDSEVETFGEDQLDLQARLARGEAEAQVSELRARINQLETVIAQERASTAAASFWDRVDAQYPGASTMDENDPLWHDFLGTTDPLSGRTYRELGSAAISVGDVDRLVSIMLRYKQPAARATQTATPTPVARPDQRRAPAPSSTPGDKEMIKTSRIDRFYEDVRRGRYAGREQERLREEALIDDAIAEGRVVFG